MTMADNIKFSKHKEVRGCEYRRYDNYDAIDVPFTDAIPCDYDGIMGVPISFLDKYCPEQFEIMGAMEGHTPEAATNQFYLGGYSEWDDEEGITHQWNGPIIARKKQYKRIVIRHKEGTTK